MKTINFFFILLCLGFIFSACEKEDALLSDVIPQMLEEKDAFAAIIDLPVGFQPEGIVVGNGHTAFVGSVFSGAILKLDLKTGQQDVLVPPTPVLPGMPGVPVVGLSFDKRSGYLFAARGLSGKVSVFNSNTGALIIEYQLTTPGPLGTTLINDLVVTKKAVYVTDTFRPFVYSIPLGPAGSLGDPSQVTEIPLTGDFIMSPVPGPLGFPANANGIDATPNGKDLILAHSDFGTLFHVNPKTGYATLIDLGGASVPTADGLLLLGGHEEGFDLYVVQNILNQITKIQLDPGLLSGNITNVITDMEFKIPSTVDDFGNYLYVVNARFDVASPFFPAPGIEFQVVRVPK